MKDDLCFCIQPSGSLSLSLSTAQTHQRPSGNYQDLITEVTLGCPSFLPFFDFFFFGAPCSALSSSSPPPPAAAALTSFADVAAAASLALARSVLSLSLSL